MENAAPQEESDEVPDLPRVLRLISRQPDRQPQLTDAELIQLRTMMRQFNKILTSCPVASRLLLD